MEDCQWDERNFLRGIRKRSNSSMRLAVGKTNTLGYVGREVRKRDILVLLRSSTTAIFLREFGGVYRFVCGTNIASDACLPTEERWEARRMLARKPEPVFYVQEPPEPRSDEYNNEYSDEQSDEYNTSVREDYELYEPSSHTSDSDEDFTYMSPGCDHEPNSRSIDDRIDGLNNGEQLFHII